MCIRDRPFDYVLYSNYERQVEAQFEGAIHLAWNSPLAWVLSLIHISEPTRPY
mgnify:CR=1 FL=1